MSMRPPIRKGPSAVRSRPSLTDMRASASTLGSIAAESVQAVRDAFVRGTSPVQTAGSGSVSSYLTRFTSDALASNIVRSTAQLGLKSSTAGSSVSPPKPEIDSAEIIEGPGGILDQFSVRISVSVPVEDVPKLASVKIMRAKLGSAKVTRPAVSALSFAPPIPGSSLDRNALAAFRVDGIGVGNKLTSFIYDDPTSSTRSVVSPDSKELRAPLPPTNNNRGVASAGLLTLAGADRSVLENLSFYLNRRVAGALEQPSVDSIEAGSRTGIHVLKGDSVSKTGEAIVQAPNPLQFSEIGRVDMFGLTAHTVGNFVEAKFIDRTVVYGTKFVYFAVGIDTAGNESPRSRLIEVSVVRTIPPSPPNVLYSVVGGHPRFSVKCPQGADHVEVFRSGRSVDESIKLGTDQSLVVQGPSTRVGEFWHLVDIGLGSDQSTTYVDTDAVAGDRLSYRFYTVDSYGLKCQTPFSCSIKMPDHGHNIPIPVPSITVEQAPGQPSVSVKMSVDDSRVAGFTVQRRDVSIHEKSVHQANQPEWFDLGTATTKRAMSRRGPTMLDADWPTYIPAAGGSASFVDTTVRLDRRYQYAIGAVDVRGNKTPLVGSQPVTVYSKTVIDPPTAFGASVVSADGQPTGIMLNWTPGTNDFSPNVIVDDQDVLAATAVRSVFQVERRQLGSPFWDALPATSQSYFFDKVSFDPTPGFRPAYVVPGAEYEYRVMAMQSGGFVSPRTEVIYISAVPPPRQPEIVWVRTTSLGSDPISVVVSWNMGGEFIERWEVERAATNKIFGEQIVSTASKMARSLEYLRVANITPEASRARSLSGDSSDLDRSVYVGNRFFVDADVHRANSYFYRVRTVGRLGVSSEWVYAGVFIKDSAFDRKFYSAISDDEKITLAQDSRPVGKASALTEATPVIMTPTRIAQRTR